VELQGNWRNILTGNATFLPSELTDSPVIGRSQVFGGFGAVTRLF
jgi:outer membrane scaffolding protein for murein synthesis (MipA/OmpV family)